MAASGPFEPASAGPVTTGLRGKEAGQPADNTMTAPGFPGAPAYSREESCVVTT